MTDLQFNRWGTPEVDPLTMATSHPAVFCGGDLAGTAETAVEAVADGKIAAWSIHRYLQVMYLSSQRPLSPKGLRLDLRLR
jgi:dihydropyrimidine dehydrogenase (NADP+)